MLGKASFIVPILVAMSVYGTANGSQYSAGRISYCAARDGHLVDVLSYVHAFRLTPTIAILLNVSVARRRGERRKVVTKIPFSCRQELRSSLSPSTT